VEGGGGGWRVEGGGWRVEGEGWRDEGGTKEGRRRVINPCSVCDKVCCWWGGGGGGRSGRGTKEGQGRVVREVEKKFSNIMIKVVTSTFELDRKLKTSPQVRN
jgi:hypothetical protein